MPEMKGDQFVALIKQRRPQQLIIMATAFVKEFNTFGRPCDGVDLVLQKPFSQIELRQAIAQVLAGKIVNQHLGTNKVTAKPCPEHLPQPPKT